MEENPSSRYPGYFQDLNYNGKRIFISVDTLVLCEICKIPMYISKMTMNKGLTPYLYPGALTLINLSPDVEMELVCLTCGQRKEAKARDLKITEQTIVLTNIREVRIL